MKSRIIYIIRHPQTVYNLRGIFQGLSDSPITEEGFAQLSTLHKKFDSLKLEKIYSSPLKRCVIVAESFMHSHNVQVKYDDRLKEICYGSWDEKSKQDVGYAQIKREKDKNRFSYIHPGQYNGTDGESYKQLYERLCPFWEELGERNENTVLVIGHTGVMIAARKHFENISEKEISEYRPSNMEVLKYEVV